ncbi:hypothetical protein [Mycolicibacterium sphagni]|uniref:Glycosyltransferase RgtA/B/C/D-like domain-containing protein n=1 Tax=Mycolicibacterium sphagni TaxID=1786 RepID=A0ABX2JPU5_9MYCO|nr:hypothetical protein [Mycolicibacterium sphagni]NTY58822.1 hypothetical protein [Mycolicibacterium sphagni]
MNRVGRALADFRKSKSGEYLVRVKVADISALALVVVVGLYVGRFANWNLAPIEDAAILMRYAEHLAQGDGIVWNVGEPPVEGATDFLFMVSVAGVHCLGPSIETAARLIAVLAHFSTLGLIYIGMRSVQRSGIVPACLSGLYFAVGPGLFFAAAYFGTPFFVFAVAAAWLLAQRVIIGGRRRIRDLLYFSLACLAAGLIRPEGVLISVFLLVALGVVLPVKVFGRAALVFGAIFIVLGGAYFLWRWSYFGYPLPNPFYVKGGGQLYADGIRDSVLHSRILLLPFIPAFLLSVRSSSTFRLGICFSIPIIATTVMWIFLSSEMNFGGRFQYPVLAMGVLSWYPLVRSLRDDLSLPTLAAMSGRQQLAAILAAGFCLASVFAVQFRYSISIRYAADTRYDVGVMLGHFASRNYTIATTEAGALPFYSRWRAIDTWGLNDEWIAHNGGITQEYLERQRPDVVVFHDIGALGTADKRLERWDRQVSELYGYVERHHFILAAVFGSSLHYAFYYYVRPDLPDRDEIVQAIRSMPPGDGIGRENFTRLLPP